MFNYICAFILSIFVVFPLNAKVYKCEDQNGVSFSSIPCDTSFIEFDLSDELVEQSFNQEEQFVVPTYPEWKSGWHKVKDLQLARFSEIVYEDKNSSSSENYTQVNTQKLTNLPQSMSVKRFAASVKDIIESSCVDTVFSEYKIDDNYSTKVFYGEYACSSRRDTQRGEVGRFKIMRGESSLYMVTVKWYLDPFDIQQIKLIANTNEVQLKKMNVAQQYLLTQVKLCWAGNCL